MSDERHKYDCSLPITDRCDLRGSEGECEYGGTCSRQETAQSPKSFTELSGGCPLSDNPSPLCKMLRYRDANTHMDCTEENCPIWHFVKQLQEAK